MSIELVMPSNHLILCRPLLLLPPIFPSIRVFSNESALCIRWPKYWGFSHQGSPHFILLLDLVLLGGGVFCFVFSSSFCFLSQQSTLRYMVTPSFPSLSFLTLRHVQLFVTPWTAARQAPLFMGFPGKKTGVGCHSLLHGIFPTQGSNPGLPHCRQILYCLSHQGSPSHPQLG